MGGGEMAGEGGTTGWVASGAAGDGGVGRNAGRGIARGAWPAALGALPGAKAENAVCEGGGGAAASGGASTADAPIIPLGVFVLDGGPADGARGGDEGNALGDGSGCGEMPSAGGGKAPVMADDAPGITLPVGERGSWLRGVDVDASAPPGGAPEGAPEGAPDAEATPVTGGGAARWNGLSCDGDGNRGDRPGAAMPWDASTPPRPPEFGASPPAGTSVRAEAALLLPGSKPQAKQRIWSHARPQLGHRCTLTARD